MKKTLLYCLFIASLASARENPFFPSEGVKDLPITSNSNTNRPQLQRSAITLPDSARILKQITVKYQNLDGSLKSKSISLDHNVDWHVPIFISQSYSGSNNIKKDKPISKYIINDFISYSFNKNSLTLITNDTLLRHFMMINPHRVVIDFQKETSVKSKNISIKHEPFTMIKYGNHSNYYRIVLVLDGKYRYKLKKHSDKIVVTIN